MDVFIQTLASGLALGSVYALVAIGYDMIWAVSRIVNFAQGDLMMVASLFVLNANLHWGWPLALAIIVGILVVTGIVNSMQEVTVRPFRGDDHAVGWLLGVLAVATILENGASLMWGSQVLAFPALLSQHYIRIAGATIDVQQIAVLVASFAIMAGIEFFYTATRSGKASRAVAFAPTVAECSGVPVRRIIWLNYTLAGVVAAVAGVLVSPLVSVSAFMGFNIGLKGLVAAIIGGLGFARGGMIGGLIIGLTEAFVNVYWSPLISDPSVFVLLIALLLVRPQGLFGGGRVVQRV